VPSKLTGKIEFLLLQVPHVSVFNVVNIKEMHIGYMLRKLKGRSLGRPRRRWVDDIIMDLREIG
jgi:hypothetical protein